MLRCGTLCTAMVPQCAPLLVTTRCVASLGPPFCARCYAAYAMVLPHAYGHLSSRDLDVNDVESSPSARSLACVSRGRRATSVSWAPLVLICVSLGMWSLAPSRGLVGGVPTRVRSNLNAAFVMMVDVRFGPGPAS